MSSSLSQGEDEAAPVLTWNQNDLGLDKRLIKAVSKLGFSHPTLIQSQCIPIAMQGKDVLVRARTGSGKTIAFALPMLHKILLDKKNKKSDNNIKALVLAPTKELCKQIEKHIIDLMYYCKDMTSIVSLSDDNTSVQQYRLQSKPDIVVTTPARLVQNIKMATTGSTQANPGSDWHSLINVSTLVMDEADLILSFGYSDDVQFIISKLPKIFQGFLMSATLSPELLKFKQVVLHNPAIIKLTDESNSGLNGHLLQFFLESTDADKFLILYVFIKLGLLKGKGLIFVNDINKGYKLKLFLQQFFIPAAVLNSELPLNSRVHILEEFNRTVFDYLIATDDTVDEGENDEDDEDDDEAEAGGEGEDDEEGDNDDDEEDDEEFEGDADEEEDDEEEEEEENEEEENSQDGSGNDNDSEQLGEDEDESAFVGKKAKSKKDKRASKPDRGSINKGYGVARGIDFRGVSFVINFDFPKTAAAYTHRIGRTARGGATGTALSFVTLINGKLNKEAYEIAVRDAEVLQQVRQQQPRLGVVSDTSNVLASIGNNVDDPSTIIGHTGSSRDRQDERNMQPAPLMFNMKELESFRYRVEDTYRSITNAAIKELRAAEIKREVLNSAKLKSFFAANPNDLKVLRHDKAVLHPIKIKEHLKFVPEYLVPESMRTVASKRNAKRKKPKRSANQSQEDRRVKSKSRDPLLNLPDDNTAGAVDANDGPAEEEADPLANDRVYTGKESLGYSSSGRAKWQERHGKGKFNPKKGKSNAQSVPGSFIKPKRKKF